MAIREALIHESRPRGALEPRAAGSREELLVAGVNKLFTYAALLFGGYVVWKVVLPRISPAPGAVPKPWPASTDEFARELGLEKLWKQVA
jgi:hypothetical protein